MGRTQVLADRTPRRRAARAAARGLARRHAGLGITWALAFVVPYIAVFLAFVAYPVVYGLWLGSDPALYAELFADPIYQRTVVNTVLFLVIGVNLKMFLALLLSGFFMRPGWWVKGAAAGLRPALGGAGAADLHLDPLDAERRVGLDQQPACTTCSASTGRPGSTGAGSALGSAHRRLHLEMDCRSGP